MPKRWTGDVFPHNLDLNQFYKQHSQSLNLNASTVNLKEEVKNFLREYVEEFGKDTELILAEIAKFNFEWI